MKVYMAPSPKAFGEDGKGSGGIWRVITAQAQHLPTYGIEIVDSKDDADLVNCHAGELVDTPKPMVASSHGLYWSGDFAWDREYWQFNAQVIEVLRRAATIITPSEWVAHAIRRDMRKPVYVIPHGVNIEDFEPGDDNGYVLWAKPRVDVVSDPEPLNRLAALALDTQFTATFGRPAQNVRITGAMAHTEFKELMRGAGVWLATTRETGDIASREAMAMGIPVLAWDWGATGELVRHKETGYLAKPGDYEDLLEGLHYCLENRERLGAAGREDIRANYQWRNLMARYASVYRETYDKEQYPVDVSIIVPAHNYASFLTECLYSIKNQRFTGKIETIVVDDASTDNTQEVLSHFDNLTVIRHQTNQGLVGSLNTGRAVARGKYWMNLDADNLIPQNTLQTLFDSLEARPWVDVASGGLAMYSPTGQHQTANDWPFGQIKVADQFAHINQQHSSSMVRARSVRGLGGYRTRQRKNEDGEYWCRAASAGLRFEQVTRNPTLVYRWHDKNKSKTEGGEDAPDGPLSWSFYFPWGPFPNLTPFACTSDAPNASWPVHSYEGPHIAVIIPCGPGHEKFLPDALDSVYGQTFRLFECIVANDTGYPIDVAAMGHPWVKVVDTEGRTGPAHARNVAIAAAKAPLIVPLDADDMLYPDILMQYYQAWLANCDSLIYADHEQEYAPADKRKYYQTGKFTIERIHIEALYQVTVLFAKTWWETVGGYDENIIWEDWLLGLKMHCCGIGACYVPAPWGVYRHWTVGDEGASQNQLDNANFGKPEFRQKVEEIYKWIERKEAELMCKGCGGKAARSSIYQNAAPPQAPPTGEGLTVVCVSPQQGSRSINSRVVGGMKYRYNEGTIIQLVPGDEWIANHKDFALFEEVWPDEPDVQLPAEPPTPAPIVVTPKPAPVAAEIVPEVETAIDERPEPVAPVPVKDAPQKAGVDLNKLATLGAGVLERLVDAGLRTPADIRADVLAGGQRILAIPGIGKVTFNKIKAAVL